MALNSSASYIEVLFWFLLMAACWTYKIFILSSVSILINFLHILLIQLKKFFKKLPRMQLQSIFHQSTSENVNLLRLVKRRDVWLLSVDSARRACKTTVWCLTALNCSYHHIWITKLSLSSTLLQVWQKIYVEIEVLCLTELCHWVRTRATDRPCFWFIDLCVTRS